MFLANVTRFDSCIFFECLLESFGGNARRPNRKTKGEALEELIGAQALTADLKTAILAALRTESRRWTVGELFDRLNILGFAAQSRR